VGIHTGFFYFILVAGGDKLVLSEQDLGILLDLLRSASPQWRFIGAALGFLNSTLKIIQSNPLLIPEGPLGYFQEMLSQWLKWAPPNHSLPTLEALVSALRDTGEERLAYDLWKSFMHARKGSDIKKCMDCSVVSL